MNKPNINRVPDEILKEIFPRKLNRYQYSKRVYTQLKRMIRSGKLKKGERLVQSKLAVKLNVSIPSIRTVFQQLIRDGFIIWRGRKGSFVA